jgi:hypothetical protein
MTNRELIWRRARNWVSGWQGGKSTPTPEIAYIAGWQAAVRQMRKGTPLMPGNITPRAEDER